MKLIIFSICKDEAETIGQVLDGIPESVSGVSKIVKLVIDDGSTDKTAEVAKEHKAIVLSDGVQKRLAFRFREAIEYCLDSGADIVVNIDGDMQFNPKDIPKLVGPIVNNEADFVAADRFTGADGLARKPNNMPSGKYYGNKLGAWVVSKFSKHHFNDVTCGFRAYSRNALIALNTNGAYTYTQESFQVLAMKRMRIVTVPTEVKYYEGRKSRVVTNIFKYIATSAMSILRSYRDFAPSRFFGWLGFLPFVMGLISGIIFLGHWFATGSFSPYKFLGFSSMYFITLAIIFWVIGLLADMLSRMLNNQEKILENIKELRYNKLNK